MLYRGLRITIAPELFVADDLIRVEQRPRFKMRRQMHGAQTALLLGNRSRGRALYLVFPPENADQRFKRASTFSTAAMAPA